jgi:transcriptional regulator with XRE-family HTH domain
MGTQHRKQHNAFTNHEVDLIRKHWPSRMPLADLLAMLPRHTENSVTGYANKVLGLSRPVVRKFKPAWDRVVALLKQRSMTQIELAAAMGFSRARASEILREHRIEVHIAAWRIPAVMGRAEALWALGNKPDAPEPVGAKRAKRLSAQRPNPFLVAAGEVSAPFAAPGRVFRQSMDVRDELEAA